MIFADLYPMIGIGEILLDKSLYLAKSIQQLNN